MRRKIKSKARKKPEPKAKPIHREKKAAIEFCKKCGSIMIPEKRRKNIFLKCRSCGYEIKRNVHGLRIVEEKKAPRGIVVLEKDETILPITDKVCEKCENTKAHWWLQQTRSADEPPTQFFRCTKCKHVWREYK